MEMEIIDSKEFLEKFKNVIASDEEAFHANFPYEGMTFCEWSNLLIRWLELDDREMCERYYEKRKF